MLVSEGCIFERRVVLVSSQKNVTLYEEMFTYQRFAGAHEDPRPPQQDQNLCSFHRTIPGAARVDSISLGRGSVLITAVLC